jgi:hypothetical protein
MKYEVYILLEIDPDATFIGVDQGSLPDDLIDQLSAALYDIDDVAVLDLSLKGPLHD